MKNNSEIFDPQVGSLNLSKPLPKKLQVDFIQDWEIDEENGGATFTYLLPPCSPKAQAEQASRATLSIGRNITGAALFRMQEEVGEISFELKESSTNFIFTMPSTIAGRSDESIAKVKELNRAYDSRVMNIQGCGTDHSTQTFTPHSRAIGSQKSAPQTKDFGSQIYSYDFEPRSETTKSSDAMQTMEKIILQNALSGEQESNLLRDNISGWNTSKADDFDLEDKSDVPEEIELKPRLEEAWTHTCNEVKGFPVNEIAWNSLNQELFAAAYGHSDFGNTGAGRIALWTLKNPAYPEKLIKTTSSCTCLQFSPEVPHILAAGFFDGSIQIYDIRLPIPEPTSNTAETGRHQQPVWQIEWVVEKKDDFRKNDVLHLLSVGGDSVIKEWTLREGIVTNCVDLMKLKRVPNQARLKGSSSSDHVSNSQEDIGSAIMASLSDPHVYYAATEDGLVHKCSVSYKEQVLKTYFGHFRRIHQLKTSPFNPEYFMTSGEDWMINLWSSESERPLIKLEPGTSSVQDCDWCPFNSCVIGSCLYNGTILVWDLSQNQKEATIAYPIPDSKLSSIQFSPKSPRLYVGDFDGKVTCFHLKDVEYLPPEDANTTKRSRERLQACLVKSR